MLAAAAAGGGFVEYYWDDPSVEEDPDSPKLTYAVPTTVLGQKFVVAAGFYMDLSSVDAGSTIFEVLEVTARDSIWRVWFTPVGCRRGGCCWSSSPDCTRSIYERSETKHPVGLYGPAAV